MKAGVIVFPGTNCDIDTKRACEFFGWDTSFVWHDETSLDKYDVVFLRVVFHTVDYIRAGRLARFSPVVMSLNNYVKNKRGMLIGICKRVSDTLRSKILPNIVSKR